MFKQLIIKYLTKHLEPKKKRKKLKLKESNNKKQLPIN